MNTISVMTRLTIGVLLIASTVVPLSSLAEGSTSISPTLSAIWTMVGLMFGTLLLVVRCKGD